MTPVPDDFAPLEMNVVGNYAVQIAWPDGRGGGLHPKLPVHPSAVPPARRKPPLGTCCNSSQVALKLSPLRVLKSN